MHSPRSHPPFVTFFLLSTGKLNYYQSTDRSAEARLLESLNHNYGELAVALVQELANPSKPLQSRTMASIFFKNTLNAKSVTHQIELHTRWKQLDPAPRNLMKETLLQAMTAVNSTASGASDPADTTHSTALRFAAIAASEVASVELPYQEWPQFLPTITAACTTHQNPKDASSGSSIQLAAYECLGLTCERIQEVQNMVPDVPDLDEPTINAMLTTIVQGITTTAPSSHQNNSNNNNGSVTNGSTNTTHEMQFMALNALNKSLQFVHSNMERKEERDFIIAHAICNIASQHNDHRIRQLAYQCLDVICAEYYDKLFDYMTQIFQLTVNAIQTDPNEMVKIAAIEFWCTMAEVELSLLADEESSPSNDATPSLCHKYVQSAMATLLPLLFDTLSASIRNIDDDDEYDEDDYDIRAAGATCIENFASTVGDPIVPVVMEFVTKNITVIPQQPPADQPHRPPQPQQHWSIRDAAIVAFSCILTGGPSTNILGQFVHDSIPILGQALDDKHPLIRDDALHCIANISREHMVAVPVKEVDNILKACIIKLQQSTKLAARAATVIFNMSQSTKSPDATAQETNVLSTLMLSLLQALLTAMDRKDSMENNLRVSAGSAASELILASAVDAQPVLVELLPAVMGRIEVAFSMNVHNTDDREMKEQLLGLLCGLITPLYQKLPKTHVLERTDQMMTLLLQVLQVPNANCHEEALRAIGAIATALDEDFTVRWSWINMCVCDQQFPRCPARVCPCVTNSLIISHWSPLLV